MKIKQVTGMYYNDAKRDASIKSLTVRVMRTREGESLSIADEQEGVMLQVPLGPIVKMLGKKGK